jgi:hypothetical protein
MESVQINITIVRQAKSERSEARSVNHPLTCSFIPNVEAISIDIVRINMLFCAYSPRRNKI